MITYLHWGTIIALLIAILFLVGGKLNSWKTAIFATAVLLLAGWGAYYFHFQQIFVKRYGGVMSVSVPEGHYHITATWKDENLWIENYDPVKNTCHFQEVSKGNVLEGKVTIKNCNPLSYRANGQAATKIPATSTRSPGTPQNR